MDKRLKPVSIAEIEREEVELLLYRYSFYEEGNITECL